MGDGGFRVAIAVIAYEAESTIAGVLDRVPAELTGTAPTLYVSDDASADGTAKEAQIWAEDHPDVAVEVVHQPVNLGYGGNQTACYTWAAERGFDAVALVHGDAQYPPEHLDDLLRPIADGRADAVFGSRMLESGQARAGGMPWSRLLGNKVLSAAENVLAGVQLSEWHSGFRAYRLATLGEIDIATLPQGFDFDSKIILRLIDAGARIEEIPIPTHYGDEISRIHPIRTGLRILAHVVEYRWEKLRNR